MGYEKNTEDLEDVSGGFTGTNSVGNGPTPPASLLEDVDGGAKTDGGEVADPLKDVGGGPINNGGAWTGT